MGIFRQFPYSNFHEMNLDEIIKIVKNMLEEWAQYYDTWDNWKDQVTQEWEEMQSFINNYFDNLNVQTEINNKITAMVNSGEFSQIVDPYIPPAVSEWLAEHITTPETVVIDNSLTIEGAAADAKATGNIKNDLNAFSYAGIIAHSITIDNGEEHGSGVNPLIINVPTGSSYYLKLKREGTADFGIYELYTDNTKFLVPSTVENNETVITRTAPKDINGIGIYCNNTSGSTATFTFYVETEQFNSIIKEKIDGLSSIDIYTKSINELANYSISPATNKIISNIGNYCIYFSAKPNTTYRISRNIVASRLLVASTELLPASNVTTSQIVRDDTASDIYITTKDSDNFVVALVYVSSLDTGYTWSQIYNSISVYEYSAFDRVARNKIDYGINVKYDLGIWERNALNVWDGLPGINANRIRTKGYCSYPNYKYVKANGPMEFIVFAYALDDTFEGVLTANGTFEISGTPTWIKEFTFTDYPTKKFKLVIRNSTATNVYLIGESVKEISFSRNNVTYIAEYSNPYYGEPIPKKVNGFNWLSMLNITNTSPETMNDIVVYGDYLICGMHSDRILIWDWKSGTSEGDISINADIICNTIALSDVFYDDDDLFPLLWCRKSDKSYAVIRIQNLTTASVVKTYEFNDGNNGIAPQVFFDFENDRAYAITSVNATDPPFTLSVYDMTSETESGDVYSFDKLSSVNMDNFGGRYRQGGKFFNGRLYAMASYTASPYESVILVINPYVDTPYVESKIDLPFMTEGEGISIFTENNNTVIFVSDYYDIFRIVL